MPKEDAVAVIANFDEEGDPKYKAWCFTCALYLGPDKTWSGRTAAVNAASKHMTGEHGSSEPAYSAALGRPSDVKVGEVR